MARAVTLPGGVRPEDASPGFVFHKAQEWDRFREEQEQDRKGRWKRLEPFKRDDARKPFLRAVADLAETVNRERYGQWHERFERACKAVDCEEPIHVETWWRLVAGWATNPAFEIGLTLDHLLGFPYVPGSAVKGLLHRVAEMELLTGEAAVPPPPGSLPERPADQLVASLRRASRVRCLFGSLAAERSRPEDPEPPIERLKAWLKPLDDARAPEGRVPEPWCEVEKDLQALCGPTATGGLVACFDAVPAARAFTRRGRDDRSVLTVDVLTPHTSGAPVPNPFLAVRDRVPFEIRFRLGALPPTAGKPRDEEEAARRRAFEGASRQELLAELKTWLLRGLAEHGLGGKTSAGYGYLMPAGERPEAPPRTAPLVSTAPKKEEVQLPPGEAFARKVLPDDMEVTALGDALDNALTEASPEEIAALARRFAEKYRERLEIWRKRAKNKKKIRERLEALGLLGEGGGDR